MTLPETSGKLSRFNAD